MLAWGWGSAAQPAVQRPHAKYQAPVPQQRAGNGLPARPKRGPIVPKGLVAGCSLLAPAVLGIEGLLHAAAEHGYKGSLRLLAKGALL